VKKEPDEIFIRQTCDYRILIDQIAAMRIRFSRGIISVQNLSEKIQCSLINEIEGHFHMSATTTQPKLSALGDSPRATVSRYVGARG
jgi:hypothetical protein